ncbi:FAS-associated death domain protein [Brachyhypopomus gauderio]|uniref:FAS-associated death domain protein n=1 Tax=Brachyhypopomus gauderio TaxID=698409 RepID=UPI00404170E8
MDRFKVMLLQISDKLGKENISDLKFLCKEKIGKKKTEEIVSGKQLFEYLIERAEIGPNDTQYLREILTEIGQNTLVEIIESYERQATSAELPDETEQAKIRCAVDILAEHLGKKWIQFGRKLGLDYKIEGIQEKHPRNLEEQVRELLKEWLKLRKAEATVDELIRGLRACSQNYTADVLEKTLHKLNMQ